MARERAARTRSQMAGPARPRSLAGAATAADSTANAALSSGGRRWAGWQASCPWPRAEARVAFTSQQHDGKAFQAAQRFAALEETH